MLINHGDSVSMFIKRDCKEFYFFKKKEET